MVCDMAGRPGGWYAVTLQPEGLLVTRNLDGGGLHLYMMLNGQTGVQVIRDIRR